jgi:hypothetical protein
MKFALLIKGQIPKYETQCNTCMSQHKCTQFMTSLAISRPDCIPVKMSSTFTSTMSSS